jgi:hypothetical protein
VVRHFNSFKFKQDFTIWNQIWNQILQFENKYLCSYQFTYAGNTRISLNGQISMNADFSLRICTFFLSIAFGIKKEKQEWCNNHKTSFFSAFCVQIVFAIGSQQNVGEIFEKKQNKARRQGEQACLWKTQNSPKM